MLKRYFVLLLLACFVVSIVNAEEGIWPLDQLNQLPWSDMKSHGLKLEPKDIYDPDETDLSEAILQIRGKQGGGTGSFVSAQGMILTNHHVAFSAIQAQSSANSGRKPLLP